MSHLSIFPGYAAAGAQLVIFQFGGGGTPGRTVLDGRRRRGAAALGHGQPDHHTPARRTASTSTRAR